MPDQSEPPAPGTPEYRWLYGDASEPGGSADDDRTRMVQRPEDPEATRMIPVVRAQKRPPRPPVDKPLPPARGVPPLPPAPAKPKRKRPPVLKIVLLVLALWVAWLAIVPFWALRDVDRVEAWPENRPDDTEGTNYLIVGSDKADDLTDEQRKKLRTGPRGGARTDTIMVLHVGDGPDVLMSLPRDTLVEVPGQGTTMINSAFNSGGPRLLVRTVEKLTGLHIDHYVELGFGSVINTVDALGGIEICPKQRMRDPLARLNIKKGCQEADGMTALGYSRSRHVTPRSDLDRVGQQREVVAALGDEVMSPATFLNPFRYWNFNNAAADSVRLSEDTGLIDLARFARAMTAVGKDGRTCTMPIVPSSSSGRLDVDDDRARKLFAALRDDSTDDISKAICTRTGLSPDLE